MSTMDALGYGVVATLMIVVVTFFLALWYDAFTRRRRSDNLACPMCWEPVDDATDREMRETPGLVLMCRRCDGNTKPVEAPRGRSWAPHLLVGNTRTRLEVKSSDFLPGLFATQLNDCELQKVYRGEITKAADVANTPPNVSLTDMRRPILGGGISGSSGGISTICRVCIQDTRKADFNCPVVGCEHYVSPPDYAVQHSLMSRLLSAKAIDRVTGLDVFKPEPSRDPFLKLGGFASLQATTEDIPVLQVIPPVDPCPVCGLHPPADGCTRIYQSSAEPCPFLTPQLGKEALFIGGYFSDNVTCQNGEPADLRPSQGTPSPDSLLPLSPQHSGNSHVVQTDVNAVHEPAIGQAGHSVCQEEIEDGKCGMGSAVPDPTLPSHFTSPGEIAADSAGFGASSVAGEA